MLDIISCVVTVFGLDRRIFLDTCNESFSQVAVEVPAFSTIPRMRSFVLVIVRTIAVVSVWCLVGFERLKKLDNTVAEDVTTNKRLRIL